MPLHVNKTILTMMLVLLFPMPGQAIILQNNLDQMNFICISSCVLLNDQDFLLTSMIFQLGEFTVFTLGVFCCFFLFSHYVLSVLLAVLSINKTSTHSLLACIVDTWSDRQLWMCCSWDFVMGFFFFIYFMMHLYTGSF